MKMSDVFELPVSVGEKAASHASAIFDGRGTFGIINDQAMKHLCHAINNHDRMTDEIAELREFVKMVANGEYTEESDKLLMAHRFIETAKSILNK